MFKALMTVGSMLLLSLGLSGCFTITHAGQFVQPLPRGS